MCTVCGCSGTVKIGDLELTHEEAHRLGLPHGHDHDHAHGPGCGHDHDHGHTDAHKAEPRHAHAAGVPPLDQLASLKPTSRHAVAGDDGLVVPLKYFQME